MTVSTILCTFCIVETIFIIRIILQYVRSYNFTRICSKEFLSTESLVYMYSRTIFRMIWWRWTLTVNLPNNQNFEILRYDTRPFLYQKYVRELYTLINYSKLGNTDIIITAMNTHKYCLHFGLLIKLQAV